MVSPAANGLTLLTPSERFPQNPLLVKVTVGKNRPTVYDLPGQDHVYGKIIERDPEECAATVLQHWNIKVTTKDAVPALDYITMNRNSAKQGIISPKGIKEYRSQHPVRVKIGDHAVGFVSTKMAPPGTKSGNRVRCPLPSDHNPNFTYGKPTRPSTPVSSLMTDRFQKEWLQKHEKKELELLALEKVSLINTYDQEKAMKKHHNKTVVSRSDNSGKKKSVKSSELFKMSKFKKVPAKISSRRQDEDPALIGITSKLNKTHIAKAAEGNQAPSKAWCPV